MLIAQIEVVGGSFAGFAFLIAVVNAVVHVVLAIAVMADQAKRTHRVYRERSLGPAWVWILVTLLTGVIGAAVYWLIHVSNLGPVPREREDEPTIRT